MSRNYDNWERLVAAVVKKQQLWQLFHEQSRSPSISSGSSGFSFSFHLSSSLDDFPTAEFSASYRNEDEFGSESASDSPSNIVVEDQSPVKNVSSKRSRRRDLKIEVPSLQVQYQPAFGHAPDVSDYGPNTCPKMASLTPISRIHPRTNWPDDSKHQSHPLPLPPVTNSNSSPSSHPNSTATSPSAPSHSPRKAENITSPVSPWKKGKFLGSGALGNVYIGFNSEIGEMCAMKEFTFFADYGKSKQSVRQLGKQLEIEIALLSSLRHPNIVQYYGSQMLGDNFYIYFEYVSGGSIYGILEQYGRLGESAIRSYTQQILSGLAYLHSKSIAHRDIKGANILVDPNGSVKLANFGIAKHIAEQSDPPVLPASPYWMAPEAILNPNVRHRAIDIWSLGCTVLEMATSRPPLSQYEWMVAMFKAGNHRELPIIPDHLSNEGKDFVGRCLQWNPAHRATASQLLEHPFVKNVLPLQKPPPLDKQTFVSTPAGLPAATNAVRSTTFVLNLYKLRLYSFLYSSQKLCKVSDIYTPRNMSSPVSPIGSPLRHPRSPQHLNERISPPHISSHHRTPSSSPHQIAAIPYHHHNNLSPNLPKHRPSISSPSYWDPNILRGAQLKYHAFQELPSRENDSHRNQLGSSANEQLLLADRVSKKLLNAPLKSNPSLDLNSSSRLPSHHMARV
ncbi:hypothetical protein BUALT_Bualt06G0108800 [Buddleja alternifolia]|uniref:Protein kinase domain-containing protein n=1 Tax=Buddleja alternifolia TaxID=168488 RepID=A0AAV6XM21_9LAMI|nr:hypothetical protein BUALT_Bualt06G0108800 [Buddleja alternifolia]